MVDEANNAAAVDSIWTKVDSWKEITQFTIVLKRVLEIIMLYRLEVMIQISMVFADGTFGNASVDPLEHFFFFFYRQSANRTMRIRPQELTDITFTIDYLEQDRKD